jgi:hypothetical protein
LYNIIIKDKKIKKIDEIMSVYRLGEGVWANSTTMSKYKFMVDNLYYILNNFEDDTIKEIMNMRLNSYALYSLPKYLSKVENKLDRSVFFEINEKIPISILINLFFKKLILRIKWFQ